MSILGRIAPQDFLGEYWQQRPLLVRGALPGSDGLVDGDTLAGLACEADVESRIVVHDRHSGSWHCRHGPFEERDFASLPERDWTLLVQGVEHWIPDLAGVLGRFDFLPRWRVDDVMASYATPGGGVGPHFDHYDVFLIQAAGERRWQLGQACDDTSALQDNPTLRLLAEFRPEVGHDLEAGDMLYLPPGLAHFGSALGEGCITLSVGFRAPSHREILQGMAACLAEGLDARHRYRDGPQAVDGDPHLIGPVVLQQLRKVFDELGDTAIDRALAQAFGRQVTEPRQPQLIDGADPLDPARLEALLAGRNPLPLRHNPASRFAYAVVGGGAQLFVDGESHATSVALARAICEGSLDRAALADAPGRDLVRQLIAQGSLRVR